MLKWGYVRIVSEGWTHGKAVSEDQTDPISKGKFVHARWGMRI